MNTYMNIININTRESYDCIVGEGLISLVPSLINDLTLSSNIALITDDIVDKLYADSLFNDLKKNRKLKTVKLVIKSGEKSKNKETLFNILEFLGDNNFNRNDYLIALGGGVVGDIVGLSSALYMRGINYIQIPTTLLSMVDSAIGGKTGIDLKSGKNLVGAFKEPKMVICDINIIKDLPSSIFKEGMAEVIKCDIIGNLGIKDNILKNEIKENIESIINKCLYLKKDIVEKDEFETNGLRKVLNLGHTISHSIEAISNYSISHGKAVGMGLLIESKISYELGIINKETLDEIINILKISDLIFDLKYDIDELISFMKNDKKNNDELISFILIESFGNIKEIKLNEKELKNILNKIMK